MKTKSIITIFFVFFINNVWCQNFDSWNTYEIDTPKWLHGTWVYVEYEPLKIDFGPEYIAFTDKENLVVGPLDEQFLPESMAQKFLVGRHYAISLYSKSTRNPGQYYQSVYIYYNRNDPLPGVSMPSSSYLPRGEEYLREVNIFKYDHTDPDDDRWIYLVSYYRKER